jgi:hypothetical protein
MQIRASPIEGPSKVISLIRTNLFNASQMEFVTLENKIFPKQQFVMVHQLKV